MANFINQNGTNNADILDFTASGTYHANGGNDTINIKGGKVIVYTDSGNNTINVTCGNGHTIQVAKTIKEGNTVNGVEKLTINGANAVDAILGAGSDVIVIEKSNGKKANGAFSAIRGGAWGDTFTVYDGAESYQLYGEEGNDTFNINGGKNMNFWGGAANDTFNIKGGSNNKIYGGDSADKFNVWAGKQNLILGYGNDIADINAGSNTNILCNLGINTINLKAGSGHIITADIDKTLSKKKGYTDAQIAQGIGLGYGVDKVNISGTATNITAHLGDGKDVVTVSSGSGHKIYTEGWGDTINVLGSVSDSIFDAGVGDDIINVSGGIHNSIYGGDGKDTITISGGSKIGTVYAGNGSDIAYITGGTGKVLDDEYGEDAPYDLDMGADNDKLTISGGSGYYIAMGSGNDIVTINATSGDNNEIEGNEGDDKFYIYGGDGHNIDGQKGNDEIYVYGGNSHRLSTGGDGNNIVQIFGGNYHDVQLEGFKNNLTIAGGNYITVNDLNKGHDGYDYENDVRSASVDIVTIKGDAKNITANLLAGDDIITVENGSGLKIDGGLGNDTFYIKGGSGIFSGETGNDTYVIDWKSILNNQIIIDNGKNSGINDRDILVLENANKNDVEFSMKDGSLFITDQNKKFITINGWTTNAISTIKFADSELKAADVNKLIAANSNANGVSQLEVIQQMMSSLNNTTLNGYDAMDEAIASCSFGKFSSLGSLVNSFINDCTTYSGMYNSSKQTDFLSKYCGINLSNEDTGAITGFDAGGANVKTSESIVPENGFSLNDYAYNTNDYFTLNAKQLDPYFKISSDAAIYGKKVNGITFYWSDDNINELVNYGYNENNLKQIISGVVNVWADPATKLVEESYKLTMNSEGSTWNKLSDGTRAIQLHLTGQPNNGTLASVNSSYRYYTSSPNITTYTNGALVINAAYFNNGFSEENGDSGSSAGYLDRVIAHEMVHGVMAANINMSGKLPKFISEGLAELVHGVDDDRKHEILDLTNTNYNGRWSSSTGASSNYNQRDLLNAVFDMNNANTKMSTYTYGGGYMLLRYLAKQVADYSVSEGLAGYFNDSLTSYTSRYGEAAKAMLGFKDAGILGETANVELDKQIADNNKFKAFVTGNTLKY